MLGHTLGYFKYLDNQVKIHIPGSPGSPPPLSAGAKECLPPSPGAWLSGGPDAGAGQYIGGEGGTT